MVNFKFLILACCALVAAFPGVSAPEKVATLESQFIGRCASVCARADADHVRKLQALQEKYVALGMMDRAVKIKELLDKRTADPINPVYWNVAAGPGFFGGDWVEHHNNRLHRLGSDRMHYDYWAWSSDVRPDFGLDPFLSVGDILVSEKGSCVWIRFETDRSVMFGNDRITRLNRKAGSVSPEAMLGDMADIDGLLSSHYSICTRLCAPLASKFTQLLQKMQKELAVRGDIDGAMELSRYMENLPKTNRYMAYVPALSDAERFRKTFPGVWRETTSDWYYKLDNRGNMVAYTKDGKTQLTLTLDGVSPHGNVFRVRSNLYEPVRYIARVGNKMYMFEPNNTFWQRIAMYSAS